MVRTVEKFCIVCDIYIIHHSHWYYLLCIYYVTYGI
jgi:hypothetical protein